MSCDVKMIVLQKTVINNYDGMTGGKRKSWRR